MTQSGTMEAQAAQVLDPLREDHQKVKQLFDEFEAATESEEKQRIVEEAIHALQQHSYVEEKVLYPAFLPALDEEQLMREALEEHHVVHLLIAELKKLKPNDERYDAKFTVLAENVRHHIKEEEGEMFPQVEESDLDWAFLAAKASEAKRQFSSKGARAGRSGARTKKAKKSA